MFSKRNKRGVIVLVIISLMVIVAPRIVSSLNPSEPYLIEIENSAIFKESFNKSKKEFTSPKTHDKYHTKQLYTRPKKRFNPNNYSLKDWMNLGLSEKQSAVILNFLKGNAKSNTDLEKIYVLPKALFELIKDSTYYDQSKQIQNQPVNSIKSSTIHYININTATLDELKSINGVGNYFANKIIQKRTELGGFYDKSQLLEVWKLDSVLLQKIENQLVIDLKDLNKININNVSVEELKNHPYFSWNIANAIVKMRNQKGVFISIEDIKASKIIDEQLFIKIKPYITIK